MSTPKIDEILAAEAEASEAGRDLDATYVRNHHRPKQPSQLYSVRLPVERIEELRVLAEKREMTPSALMRRIVIDGLDRAADTASRMAEALDSPGPGGERMVVMTPEQTRQLVGDVVRITAKAMLAEVLPEILHKVEGGSTGKLDEPSQESAP